MEAFTAHRIESQVSTCRLSHPFLRFGSGGKASSSQNEPALPWFDRAEQPDSLSRPDLLIGETNAPVRDIGRQIDIPMETQRKERVKRYEDEPHEHR